MKRFLLSLLASTAMAGAAQAVDLSMPSSGEPPLEAGLSLPPDSGSLFNWSGLYGGIHAGRSQGEADVKDVGRKLTREELANTLLQSEAQVSEIFTLRGSSDNDTPVGAFIGYNSQFGDAVVGIEADYTRSSMNMRSQSTIGRSYNTSNGLTNNIQFNGSADVRIKDYGTLRVRGGWVYDRFMPFGTIGVAIGQADVRSSLRTDWAFVPTDPTSASAPPPGFYTNTRTRNKNNAISVGLAGGVGVDVGITPNLFLRAEWQYVYFPDFAGAKVSVNTGRIGAALKF